MNILVFTTAFYPSIGGLEKQTFDLIHEFSGMGHKVKVINLQILPNLLTNDKFEKSGIEIYYRPSFLQKIRLFFWCNILYMPNFSFHGIWFLFFFPFKKWVVSHNDYYLSNRKSIITRIKLLSIKIVSHNIAVSNSVANYINTNSHIIYNCYDDKTFKIYSEEIRQYDFVFLGRLASQKGCDLLIRACKNLKVKFTLNIIGDGTERQRLETMVEDLKLNTFIKFLGVLEGEILAQTLNRHRTMIIPSIGEEGFGIVALEGLACGCKIIAADAGGLPEAVNNFGKVFRMGNQKELELLLEKELLNPDNSNQNMISKDLAIYLNSHTKGYIANKYILLFK